MSTGHANIGCLNMQFCCNKIIEKLSVRQAENLVKLFKNKKQISKRKRPNILALELSISNKMV